MPIASGLPSLADTFRPRKAPSADPYASLSALTFDTVSPGTQETGPWNRALDLAAKTNQPTKASIAPVATNDGMSFRITGADPKHRFVVLNPSDRRVYRSDWSDATGAASCAGTWDTKNAPIVIAEFGEDDGCVALAAYSLCDTQAGPQLLPYSGDAPKFRTPDPNNDYFDYDGARAAAETSRDLDAADARRNPERWGDYSARYYRPFPYDANGKARR
jgi:hypothetical protein